MSAITKHEPGTGNLDAMLRMAGSLRQAGGMLPSHLRSEGEILAVILAGQELGLPPMAALRSLYIVHGKVGLSYDAMIGLLRRNGYTIQWEESTASRAVLLLTHPDGTSHREVWDVARAKTAGLHGRDMWKKYPDTMLRARCVSSAARAFAGDVLAGCYSADEVREISGGHVQAHDNDGHVTVELVDDRGANESHHYGNPEHDEARDRAVAIAEGFAAKHLGGLEECLMEAAVEMEAAGEDGDEIEAVVSGHERAIRDWVAEHGAEYMAACQHPATSNVKTKIFRRLQKWAVNAGLPQTLPGQLLAALRDAEQAAE